MKSFSRFFHLALVVIILSVVILIALGRTLGNYFIEDDFGEVLYVSQIFSGDWHKLLSNFTGNYMEIPTMKVYRPCLLLSIMADYAVWKTNATGYFITNISFLIGSAVMLYLLILELSRDWYRPRAIIFALLSATLFAASPLHCESIALMVGRVDIICAFFYLLSLWCLIRKGDRHNWLLTTIGIISFWIALLTKEMAIGLPIVLTTVCFLFPNILTKQLSTGGLFTNQKQIKTFSQKLKMVLNITYPLWLSCLFYFAIRYLALGTLLGGYTGSIGASQFSHIIEKWSDLDTLSRILLPLNKAVFHEQSIYHLLLFISYTMIVTLILCRLIMGKISGKWLLLLLIWTGTSLAPIYQLWGLGFNLEGARFLFFLTIPLAIVLPLLVLSPSQSTPKAKNINLGSTKYGSDINITELGILIPSLTCLLFLVILNIKITAKNNIPWIHAAKQTRALLEQGQNLASTLETGKKAILLGIPSEIDGAHVIYNGSTFNFLMSPPFAKDYYADRFLTFKPILFGNTNLINTSRFKKELASPNTSAVFLWKTEKMTFEKLALSTANYPNDKSALLSINLPESPKMPTILPFLPQHGHWQVEADHLYIKDGLKGCTMAIEPFNINPLNYDFLEFEAIARPALAAQQIKVSWENSDNAPAWADEDKAIANSNYSFSKPPSNLDNIFDSKTIDSNIEFKLYRIPLSRYWQWLTHETINKLYIELPAAQFVTLRNIRLISDESIIPKLSVIDLQPDNRGVYQISQKSINLKIDNSSLKNSKGIKLQLSKPNYFFENFASNSDQAVLSTIIVNETNIPFSIATSLLPASGYYQIRAIGLNINGTMEGEWSDPLTVRL